MFSSAASLQVANPTNIRAETTTTITSYVGLLLVLQRNILILSGHTAMLTQLNNKHYHACN